MCTLYQTRALSLPATFSVCKTLNSWSRAISSHNNMLI